MEASRLRLGPDTALRRGGHAFAGADCVAVSVHRCRTAHLAGTEDVTAKVFGAVTWTTDRVSVSIQFDPATGEVLTEILGQEITPELIPTQEGVKPQATEDSVGPYALQDFTLYHVVRRGYRPSKIAFLAWHAWRDAEAGEWPPGFAEDGRAAYDLLTIRKWLVVFVKRFFSSQFKRSALPNGPKVSAGGTMSPRGDWRMPSDASAAAWLAEIDRAVPTEEPA